MKPSEIVFSDTVITNQHSTIVLQPGVQSFDLPTALVSSQLAAILRSWLHSVRLMRSDQFNAFRSQSFIQRIAIVSFVSDQPLWSCQDKSRCESCFHKGDFIPLRALCGAAGAMWMAIGRPERSATAMTFVPLPRLVFPTARPLF